MGCGPSSLKLTEQSNQMIEVCGRTLQKQITKDSLVQCALGDKTLILIAQHGEKPDDSSTEEAKLSLSDNCQQKDANCNYLTEYYPPLCQATSVITSNIGSPPPVEYLESRSDSDNFHQRPRTATSLSNMLRVTISPECPEQFQALFNQFTQSISMNSDGQQRNNWTYETEANTELMELLRHLHQNPPNQSSAGSDEATYQYDSAIFNQEITHNMITSTLQDKAHNMSPSFARDCPANEKSITTSPMTSSSETVEDVYAPPINLLDRTVPTANQLYQQQQNLFSSQHIHPHHSPDSLVRLSDESQDFEMSESVVETNPLLVIRGTGDNNYSNSNSNDINNNDSRVDPTNDNSYLGNHNTVDNDDNYDITNDQLGDNNNNHIGNDGKHSNVEVSNYQNNNNCGNQINSNNDESKSHVPDNSQNPLENTNGTHSKVKRSNNNSGIYSHRVLLNNSRKSNKSHIGKFIQ